ncbi:MAG TPA: hypothetical protein VMS96_10070, partial [Terriglobales bacterium]|nr:hypothetical protein [Terriglobales bacterium]
PLRPLPPRPAPPAPESKAPVTDAAAQTGFGPLAPTFADANFEGMGAGLGSFFGTSVPPDTDGAVGRTQYVQLVNTSFTVFDKTSHAIVAGPTDTKNLWSTLPGPNPCITSNDGDGIVLYDHLADRWIITQFANFSAGSGPYYECVAISKSADATGQYFLYFFTFIDFTQTIKPFPDYPKVGVWPDAYYFTYNAFASSSSNTFVAGFLCALDRSNMLDGAGTLRGVPGPSGGGLPAGENQVCFTINDFALLPSDLDGATLPPAGSPNYFLEWFDTSHLGLWKFHVDFNTLTNSTLNGVNWVSPVGPDPNTAALNPPNSPIQIPVTAFTQTTCPPLSSEMCVPQLGTTQKLDTLSHTVMHRLAYRNFGSHESLVTNHTVTVSGHSAIRWYELRDLQSTPPTVFQSGTWSGSPPDSNWRWMGSAAMDKFGNLAIGYSVSSGSMNPAIRYAARSAGDLAGTLADEVTLVSGNASEPTGFGRWGDYSALTVDPQDDCTFWYTNEYYATPPAPTEFDWRTRIGSFKLAQCQSTPSNISVTPDSGSGSGGTFSFLYADTGGFALITAAEGLFNSGNSLTSSCAFHYDRGANTFRIYDNTGTLGGTTATPGVGPSLSNNQCTLSIASATVGSAGNSLVLNVPVTFTTPAFNGNKNIYMNVSDTNGTTTGFQQFGSWTVQ